MFMGLVKYYIDDIPSGGLHDNSPALIIGLLAILIIGIGVLTGLVAFIRQVIKNQKIKAGTVLPAIQAHEAQVTNGSIAGSFEKAWNRFLLTSGIIVNICSVCCSVLVITQLPTAETEGTVKLFGIVVLLCLLAGNVCAIVIPIRSGRKQSHWENSIQITALKTAAEKVKWLLVRQFLQKICLCPIILYMVIFRDRLYLDEFLGNSSIVYLLCFQMILSVSGLIAVVRLVKSGQISMLRAAVSGTLFLLPIFDLVSMRLLYKKADYSISDLSQK